ncbi:MAG TPA: hypothetical protein VK906_18160 [Egicoccus sp.]|nr:hypothetical protein [Egicoccus sp.]HSK25116.1 hypothetical protein [Egicoccus sp.]
MPTDTAPPSDRLAAATLAWLLDADPAIRWQVLQDLVDAPADEVAAARARVATSGWGRRLLDLQDPDGRWAQALYSPKWTSTTYTLLLLDRLGLRHGHPQALRGCEVVWGAARRYDGGLNLAKTVREPETCITAMLVRLAVVFGHAPADLDLTVGWLVAQQLADGGWNCDTVRTGSQHGSFNTTISVLEALHLYAASGAVDVAAAMAAGRDFFLAHRLYRSHRTGAVVDPAMTRFPFPPQWHFDVLRGLEWFRASGSARDARLTDAVELVRAARAADGRWRRPAPYPGRTWFVLEPAGPSRWATLRAARVLRWWDAAPAAGDQG